ncbi:MAG: glycosyltransferase [Thermotogota bacterium]
MIKLEVLFIIMYVLLFIDIFFFSYLLLKKFYMKKYRKKENYYRKLVGDNFKNISVDYNIENRVHLNQLIEHIKIIDLNKEEANKLTHIFINNNVHKKYIKNLNSKSKLKRKEAAMVLGYIINFDVLKELEISLIKEKKEDVKFYMAWAIVKHKNKNSIPVLLRSIKGSTPFYFDKISSLIKDYGRDLYYYLSYKLDTEDEYLQKLIINFASFFPKESFRFFLIEKATKCKSKEIKVLAVNALRENYPEVLDDDFFLKNEDEEIRKKAIEAIAFKNNFSTIKKISEFLADDKVYQTAISTVSTILRSTPSLIENVVDLFKKEKNPLKKQAYARILSLRIDYFMYKLMSRDKEFAKEIIKEIMFAHKTSEIIDFVNKNKVEEIEKEMISVMKTVKSDDYVNKELSYYLKDDLLEKINIDRLEPESLPHFVTNEKSKIKFQWFFLFITFLIPILVFTFTKGDIIAQNSTEENFKIFVVDFNIYLGFYVLALNFIYLFLMFFSYYEKYRQEKLWNIKNMEMLTKPGILPSITIIAPAYNEEKNIVESVNSLLSIDYPGYELVVVNDGSKDSTLETLKSYFYLEKVDYVVTEKLKTRPIRGIYVNKNIPNLIVIDKENGGKADSLNVGINTASNEYVCGIDADSILESDSLYKLVSLTIDEPKGISAMGGNIIPVNGSKTDRGYFEEIKIPKNPLALFQTIEYIRAFLAGRLGWSSISSLLIISGAFGLFNRKDTIAAGGYLTESERYGKNTLGEDMELVVRVLSGIKERKSKSKISFVYNANAWTEVPEKILSLFVQRDRWQKGLLDILHFHRKKIFNKNYGTMGLIGLPYYFIFEALGPIFEFSGIVVFLIGLYLNIVSLEIFLFLFIAVIMLGTVVSLSSFIIAEDEVNYFSFRETIVLLLFSILENFGYRQFQNFIRLFSYFNSMRNRQSWGKSKRKGFRK